MPIEVTNRLSPPTQRLADCRETVTKAAAEVERLKDEMKTAKAVLEEAQGALNLAVDDLIRAEREPTLFDNLKGDAKPAAEGDGRGSGDGGEVLDAEYEVNPPGVASLPAGETGETRAKKGKRGRKDSEPEAIEEE